jgi:hypothetical protein
LLLDSAVVFTRIRDSIVDVAIGNDTIKILKQEYAPALTSVLTWTITPKFPIQLKAYILVFRNGQLLNNDQFNLTDTNQITIVSTSFKVGANYTVATVSGIGSVGSAQGDPVYPEAGIAVSTGTTWTTSIPNNSNSWNIAFNDKINNAVFSGTDTKTLTLTQYDGGTFAPTFTDLQGVTGVTAGTGLTGGTISTTGTLAVDTSFLFTQSDTLSLNLTSRFAAKQNTLDGTGFVKSSGTNITYDNSSYLRTGLADSTYLKLTGGTLTGNLSVNGSSTLRFTNIYDKGTYTPFNVGIGEQSILNVGAYLRGGTVMLFPDSNLVSSSANLFLANSNVLGVEYSAFGSGLRNYSKQGGDNRRNSLALYTSDIGQQNTNRIYINYNGDIGINDDTPIYKLDVNGTFGVSGAATLSSTLAVQGDITENGYNVLTNLDTASLSSRINVKLSATDTASLSNRINLKYDKTGGTISGAVTLSTTTATPTSLLGKDGSNVVGTVTTLAQTGLMTRGETTATTGSPSAVFTVTHGLGSNPSAVIVTSAGIGGGDKIIFEVYTKSNTTFSVQAWNLDGTEAASKSVKIYWLAIK